MIFGIGRLAGCNEKKIQKRTALNFVQSFCISLIVYFNQVNSGETGRSS